MQHKLLPETDYPPTHFCPISLKALTRDDLIIPASLRIAITHLQLVISNDPNSFKNDSEAKLSVTSLSFGQLFMAVGEILC